MDGAVAEPDATTPAARTSDGEDGPGSELEEACLDVAQQSAERAPALWSTAAAPKRSWMTSSPPPWPQQTARTVPGRSWRKRASMWPSCQQSGRPSCECWPGLAL